MILFYLGKLYMSFLINFLYVYTEMIFIIKETLLGTKRDKLYMTVKFNNKSKKKKFK